MKRQRVEAEDELARRMEERKQQQEAFLLAICQGGDLPHVADVNFRTWPSIEARLRHHVPPAVAHFFERDLTPLMIATLLGREPLIQWLLAHGANPDQTQFDSPGRTALWFAVRTRQPLSMVRLLRPTHANPLDSRLSTGTILPAIVHGRVSIVQELAKWLPMPICAMRAAIAQNGDMDAGAKATEHRGTRMGSRTGPPRGLCPCWCDAEHDEASRLRAWTVVAATCSHTRCGMADWGFCASSCQLPSVESLRAF
jgi:hypothetical protein